MYGNASYMLSSTVSSGSSNEHLLSQTSVETGRYLLWIIGVGYTVFTILIASVLTLKTFSRFMSIARFFNCLNLLKLVRL